MNTHRLGRGRSLIALGSAALLTVAMAGTATSGAANGATTKPSTRPAVAGGVATLDSPVTKGQSDNAKTGLMSQQDALREAALERRIKGNKAAQKSVVKMPKGQWVELDREGVDKIFVVLVEFGDEQYPDQRFQGPPKDGSATDVTGPLHNEIPEPDRSIDNSTLWLSNYDRAHYEDMYFNRMARYYETQSSGRYSVDGAVTDWVKVPFNEALYGRNYCGGIVCSTSKALVRDALAVWVQSQLDSGQTMAQIQDYLKTFDQQDRYDIDGDGNFQEPDGVIDHFQIVHAGGDEAAGDPNQGTDAIWSHRSGANLQLGGPLGVGVDVGSNSGLVSSSKVPDNPTGMWVYDYTMQPENGGLGVFAHEFGHDLGLPDLYDTSGNTGGAENNTAFWTLMSSGANIGDGGCCGIGDAPTDMGAWERLQLGWLAPQGKNGPFYETVEPGEHKAVQLGPNTPNSKKPSALITTLPDHDLDLGAPATGDWMFWSDQGAMLDNTMTRSVSGGGPLTAQVKYQTEEEFDYAYLEATGDGTTWAPVQTNLSRTDDPNDANLGYGITGESDGWVDLTATLPAGTTAIRFRYVTDPFVNGRGLQVDDVTLDGTLIGGAETADEGWTFDGFMRTQRKAPVFYAHYYIAENRQYDGYDTSLETAYNFGFLDTDRPDWVEFQPYQPGLLVSYADTQYEDNNVGDHPGHGQILPVDAHPQLSHWADGTLMRPRILSGDSTFGLTRTDAVTLHQKGVAATLPSYPAVSTFDDTETWWFDSDQHGATGSHPGRYQPGWYSVDVPKTGTTIRVVGSAKRGNALNVQVN